MAHPLAEPGNTPASDKIMLSVAVLLVLAGVVGFYWLSDRGWYYQGAALFLGCGIGLVLAFLSASGKKFIGFSKDAYREVRKVVWPSRKEAVQTTLVVFGFVLLMAVYLWMSDKTIEWIIFSLILGWK